MPFDAQRTDTRPTNVRWLVFALGAGTSWMLYLHRYTFALIKPKLGEEWGIDNTGLGVLDGGFGLFYSACQFPLGVAVDLIGPHLLLGGMILAWSIFFGLHAWAPGVKSLWWIRGGFGAAQAGTFAALTPITRNWFPLSVRTTVQGIVGTFAGRTGGLCANILFAVVLVSWLGYDWRTAVWIFTAAGIVLGLVFLAFCRNTPAEHPLVNDAERRLIAEGSPDAPSAGRPRMSVREMFRRMRPRAAVNVLTLASAATFSTMADNIYSHWTPLFFKQVHHVSDSMMGWCSALPLLGGAVGGMVGGLLNDRLPRRFGSLRWARSLVGFGGKGMAAACLLLALAFYDNLYVFTGMLVVVKFFADWSLASRWGVITDIGGTASASVSALNNAIAQAIGGIIAPIAIGYVSEASGWRTVFGMVCAAYVLCAVSWLFVDCRIPVLAEEPSNEDATRRPRR
ncbi:MAG: MFS transporter [Planctomycetales bacterium]